MQSQFSDIFVNLSGKIIRFMTWTDIKHIHNIKIHTLYIFDCLFPILVYYSYVAVQTKIKMKLNRRLLPAVVI